MDNAFILFVRTALNHTIRGVKLRVLSDGGGNENVCIQEYLHGGVVNGILSVKVNK